MKPDLTQAENVVASIYYFNNQSEAIQKKISLNSDTLKYHGLIKANKHLVVNYKSKILPDTLKKTLFALNVNNNPARIIELNGKYIVVVKEREKGTRTRNLEEAKDLVITQINNQRLYANKKAKLAILKGKYKPIIDLVSTTSTSIASN